MCFIFHNVQNCVLSTSVHYFPLYGTDKAVDSVTMEINSN